MIWRYRTFKRLIIPLIPTAPKAISGRDLRKRFTDRTGHGISIAKFYFWMRDLEDEDIARSFDSQDIDGRVRNYFIPIFVSKAEQRRSYLHAEALSRAVKSGEAFDKPHWKKQ